MEFADSLNPSNRNPEDENPEKVPTVISYRFDSFSNTYIFDLHYGVGQEFQLELVPTDSTKEQVYRPIVVTDKSSHLSIKVPEGIRLLEPKVKLFWRKKLLIDPGVGHQPFKKVENIQIFPVEKQMNSFPFDSVLGKIRKFFSTKAENPQRKWKI